jgi:hypothetical protein
MPRRPFGFKAFVHDALIATPIPQLLEKASAVVLERIARGGGATRWFYCSSTASLAAIEDELAPGSVVSFYFDGRIMAGRYSPEVKATMKRLVALNHEVLVGTIADQVEINMEIISGPKELEEYAPSIALAPLVFYGEFPGRDSDGIRAVTLTLPDADGIVRAHPH